MREDRADGLVLPVPLVRPDPRGRLEHRKLLFSCSIERAVYDDLKFLRLFLRRPRPVLGGLLRPQLFWRWAWLQVSSYALPSRRRTSARTVRRHGKRAHAARRAMGAVARAPAKHLARGRSSLRGSAHSCEECADRSTSVVRGGGAGDSRISPAGLEARYAEWNGISSRSRWNAKQG